jgi:hypothetical protein
VCGLSPGDRTGTRSSHTERNLTIRRKLQTEEKDGPQRLYMRLNFRFSFHGRTAGRKKRFQSQMCVELSNAIRDQKVLFPIEIHSSGGMRRANMLLVSSFDRLNIKWNESDSLLSYRLPRKSVPSRFYCSV